MLVAQSLHAQMQVSCADVCLKQSCSWHDAGDSSSTSFQEHCCSHQIQEQSQSERVMPSLSKLIAQAESALHSVSRHLPQFELDSIMNH